MFQHPSLTIEAARAAIWEHAVRPLGVTSAFPGQAR